MANRRELTFATLDQVMPDVERLLGGHSTVRQWSLGQICNHLAGALRMSVHGYDGPRPPWFLRMTIAPFILRRLLSTGKMAEGIKVPEQMLPKAGLDARTEAEALRTALAEFASHNGPYREHPFFGRMTREQWTQLHRIHCAHHLSFALPSDTAG
jgi:Protein of unknown function (DUF1569)